MSRQERIEALSDYLESMEPALFEALEVLAATSRAEALFRAKSRLEPIEAVPSV